MIKPVFFKLPAESAHYTAMNLFSRVSSLPLVSSQIRKRYCVNDPRLKVELFGLSFPNPVGLAAGFDKEGRWYPHLSNLGFGSIEIGTVTGQPQPGNPKPRMFRLPQDQALINRLGFNSKGCKVVARHLERIRSTHDVVLGINIGKSKVVELKDAAAEYKMTFETLFEFADYVTINVSSPNTPNLRQLQNRDHLVEIIDAVQQSNSRISQHGNRSLKPVLLKIAPDLSLRQLADVADVAQDQGIDGIIATNTTISREYLRTSAQTIQEIGNGGLSGRPLHQKSLEIVKALYQQLQGRIPIIGVGGITSGTDAWNMITAGANLIQLYTGFIYGGPGFIGQINRDLVTRLEAAGAANISEMVGSENQ